MDKEVVEKIFIVVKVWR